jgi:Fms-interacting protein/Thoc5
MTTLVSAAHAHIVHDLASQSNILVATTSKHSYRSFMDAITASTTNYANNTQLKTAGDKLGIAVDIVPAVQYNSVTAAAGSSQLATASAKTATAADAGTKRRKHHHPDTATTTAVATSAASEPELLALVRSSRQLRAPADSTAAATTAAAAATAATVSAAEALKCAPEAVQLRLRLGTADGPFKQGTEVTLQLQYLPALGLVAVAAGGAHAPAHLLTNLFPGDSGAVSPNLSNAHSVAAAAGASSSSSSSSPAAAAVTFQYPEAVPARPYRWTQWLCGLYYSAPAETGAAERAPLEPSTRAVVTRIRSRIVSRAVLEYQLQQVVGYPLLSGTAVCTACDTYALPGAAIDSSLSVLMLQVELKACTGPAALCIVLTLDVVSSRVTCVYILLYIQFALLKIPLPHPSVASQFSAPLPKGALLKWEQLPTESAITELFHPAVAAAAAAAEQSDALAAAAAAAEATDDASADAAAANSDNDDEDISSAAMDVEEVDFSEDVNAYNREQAAAAAAAAVAKRSSTQQQQPQPQQHRWELHGCRYYKALLRTGSSSSSSAPLVEALIEISPEYPLRPPALLLRAADSGSGSSTAVVPAAAADSFSASDFAAVEAEVNAHCAELMGSDVRGWDHVVTHQLLRAVACFQSLNKGGAAASASASAGAAGGEADRLRRGRARRGKVLYDELTKSFDHR